MVRTRSVSETQQLMQRDGPDDPENPRNWNTTSKTMLSVNVMILTVMTYMGSSIYTLGIAGHNSVMEDFNTSQTLGVYVSSGSEASYADVAGWACRCMSSRTASGRFFCTQSSRCHRSASFQSVSAALCSRPSRKRPLTAQTPSPPSPSSPSRLPRSTPPT